MKKNFFVLIGFALTSLFSSGQNRPFNITSGNLTAGVTAEGVVSIQAVKNNKFNFPVKIFNTLEGCELDGEVTSAPLAGKGIEYNRLLINKTTNVSCILTERFSPGIEGIHCEFEIRGTGKPWTAMISTNIAYGANEVSQVWAPWGDSRISVNSFPNDGMLNPEKVTPEQNWTDPLLPRTFFNDTLYYGAPYFQYNKPGIAFCPFQWNLLCIPMVSILEVKEDSGISVILNPEDSILDMTMQIQSDGNIAFNRLFNRISDKNVLKFSYDIITHEADWRGGLRWMSHIYPEYFNPSNLKADAMAGTGAYSNSDVDFDAVKMKKMAFSVNWKASFDFPYMGMFIPPVRENEEWTRFGGGITSILGMQQYARKMKDLGFHVLSYFNVTEFGSKLKFPLEGPTTTKDSDLWKSANDFLSLKLKSAILPVPVNTNPARLNFYPKTKQGGVYFTWEDALVMDCGEPVYKDFLLDQALKHIQYIPASDGICIDRMDWLRMYNENRDDGISWYIDRPARSLITSWKNLMKDLCPLMHKNDKVIFVNNHDKRIDLLKDIDGIFDEFTYSGVPLNLTALLCINKPALGWTANNKSIKSEGADNFFQKYLYMGVYPMAPFPGNDHSIRPDKWTDQQYLDYGPLLSAMRGKKWVLEPHCTEVVNKVAKANLFKVPEGYVIPVVFGSGMEKVVVIIRNVSGLKKVVCKAIYPGSEKTTILKSEFLAGKLQIHVPLVRGCAMVKIEKTK
jgi:hypothetical protein